MRVIPWSILGPLQADQLRVASSLSRILNYGHANDFISKIPAQIIWRSHVGLSAQKPGKLPFHSAQADHTWNTLWIEFDEHVHVTFFRKALRKHGSEKRELRDVVPLTERG